MDNERVGEREKKHRANKCCKKSRRRMEMRKKNILDYFASIHANASMTHRLFVYFGKCKLIRAKSLGMTSFVMRLFSSLYFLHREICQSNHHISAVNILSYIFEIELHDYNTLFFLVYLFLEVFFFFCLDFCLCLCTNRWRFFFLSQRQNLFFGL